MTAQGGAGLGTPRTFRTQYTAAKADVVFLYASSNQIIQVTQASATLSNATSVDVAVLLGFGTTATPTGYGVVLSHPGLAAGSGVVLGNGSGLIGQGAVGQSLLITSDVPTDGALDVSVTFYVIEN